MYGSVTVNTAMKLSHEAEVRQDSCMTITEVPKYLSLDMLGWAGLG